jgi:peptidoglycan/LPS O-acetylase OafA/YrhL
VQSDGGAAPARSGPSWLERVLARETSGGQLLPQVDGLRCVAIASVLAYHINGYTVAKTPYTHTTTAATDPLCRIFAQGHVGVQLFFVISGFILALPFARQHLRAGKVVTLGDYFLRRLIRLEPPYAIALTLTALLLVVLKGASIVALLPHYIASLFYVHYFLYGRGSDIIFVA